MKFSGLIMVSLLVGLFFSPSSLRAQGQDDEFTAIDCWSPHGAKPNVGVKITSNHGSEWQDATVWITSTNGTEYRNALVIQRRFGFSEVSYWGAGFDLKIDTFSQGGIRLFEIYDAHLDSAGTTETGNISIPVQCEFLPF